MDFDQLSLGLLTTKSGTPQRSQAENHAIQDAHMSHLADLHDAGFLVAAGPLANEHFRGMLLFKTDVEHAKALMQADPAVLADWFDVTVIAWMIPGGAMYFTPTTFPRSMEDTN